VAKQKIIKTGNSLAVTIPSRFTQAVGIKAGQEVKVKTDLANAQVTYAFSGTKQLPLAQSLVKKRRKRK
jgi:antitoxin component of MazEF toxin-antitoxin module